MSRNRQRLYDLAAIAVSACCLLVLSGCGFQLRSAADLPEEMATTWVDTPDSTSLFTRELKLLLRGNDVEVVDGDVLLAPESLRLVRDFQFDEQEILGATSEEELIRDNLRREMAAALLRRLEAFGRT
ncbi:MAG: hypothetical protein LC637_14060 [Xanthomonadaceae bacterium]|nr:hypothetical protein [Xanthomonadaceae bacterium]